MRDTRQGLCAWGCGVCWIGSAGLVRSKKLAQKLKPVGKPPP
jgi:hypothetical protein